MRKLYCYVDEAGQHTEGKRFVVSVVFVNAEPERERLTSVLEQIELTSGNRRQKWNGSKHHERFPYLQAILAHQDFAGKLFFAQYADTRDYIGLTIKTVASAISYFVVGEYKATIFVDALQERQKFAASLHKSGIRTKKVRDADD